MAEWIAANRQWIATRITDYIQRLVKWLSDGGWNRIVGTLKSIGDGMSRVKDFLGGWKGTAKAAGIAIGLLFAAPVLTGLAGLIASLGTVLGIMKAISRIGKGDSGSIVEGARGAAGKEVARRGMSLPGVANDNPAAGAVKKGLLRRGLGFGFKALGSVFELYQLWNAAKEGWSGDFQKSQYSDMIARVEADLKKAQSPERRAQLQSMLNSLKAGQQQSGLSGILGSLFGLSDARAAGNTINQREYSTLSRKLTLANPMSSKLMEWFMKRGYSSLAATGIVTNLAQESNLDPTDPRGFAHWTEGRRKRFIKEVGTTPEKAGWEKQAAFIDRELHGPYANVMKRMQAARSAGEATGIFGMHYEIPQNNVADRTLDVGARARAGQDFYDRNRVQIEIIHSNVPPGTQLNVMSKGNAAQVGHVRQQRAMSPTTSATGN